MKLGLLTNSLSWVGIKTLDAIAAWASSEKLNFLEVGPAIPLEPVEFYNAMSKYEIEISALIYCRNFLSSDVVRAEEFRGELVKRIRFAGEFGIRNIVCSTGVTSDSFYGMNYDPEKSLAAVIEYLKTIIEEAETYNVSICLENCPMMGNIAISPYMWDKIFDGVNSEKLGLAYDPSHMVWQFMDAYNAISQYGSKIFHVHAKDTEVLHENLGRIGVLHNINTVGKFFPNQWWRHRLPGMGDLDWKKIFDLLKSAGFNGVVSLEHEDPIWEGTEEKVKKGIIYSRDHLKAFI